MMFSAMRPRKQSMMPREKTFFLSLLHRITNQQTLGVSILCTAMLMFTPQTASAAPHQKTYPPVPSIQANQRKNFNGTWYLQADIRQGFTNFCESQSTLTLRAGTTAQFVCYSVFHRWQSTDATIDFVNPARPGEFRLAFSALRALQPAGLGFGIMSYLSPDQQLGIIAEDDRRAVFVLSRGSTLPPSDWKHVKEFLSQQQYNPCQMTTIPTTFDAAAPVTLCKAPEFIQA